MPLNLRINMNQLEKDIEQRAAKITQRTSEKLFKKIVTRNPIDTGFSSRNWNMTLDEADTSVRGDREQGIIPTFPRNEVGELKNLAKKIYLANGVNYIRDLEYGSASRQAPNGFVLLSVAEVISSES